MIEPKTQQDLVEQFMENIGESNLVYDEELHIIALKTMHQLDASDLMDKLDMVFRMRNGLTNIRWELHNPDNDNLWEKGNITEKNIVFPNLKKIAGLSRKDKSEAFLKCFLSTDKLVGVSWELGESHFKVYLAEEERDLEGMITRIWVSYDKNMR